MKNSIWFPIAAAVVLFLLMPPNGSGQSSRKGYLGVVSERVTKRIVDKYDLPVDYGAFISSVVDGSAADEAGIRPKDVIVKIGDDTIHDDEELTYSIRHTKPDTDVKIELYRHGEKKFITATMDRLKSSEESSFSFHWLGDIFSDARREFRPRGVKAQDITKQLGEYFGAPDGRGVLITEVRKGGVVDKAGFKAGDVITKIDGHATEDLSELLQRIHDREGKEADVELVRSGKAMTLKIKIPDEDEDWY